MPGLELNIISNCARSPYFKCTSEQVINYGECGGRLMPLALKDRSMADEYWTMRKAAGLFDVPERPVEIKGPDSIKFMNRVFTRDCESLKIGRGRYGILCHQRGGIVCDGVMFRLAEDRFWYIHADHDVYSWLVAHAHGYDVNIVDPRSWALQIQGPRSLDILEHCCDGGAPEPFNYFYSTEVTMGGQPVMISRTGWTGELGFEIYSLDPKVDGAALWLHLLNAGSEFGLEFCGTLSMNPRRIEAGILNYGTDMYWETTPFDMGLGMFVDLEAHDFIGREALFKADRRSRFTGFKSAEGDFKWGSKVLHNGSTVGRVKAFDHSPYLDCGVGFVLLDKPELMTETEFSIFDRSGQERPVELTALPFYDAEKRIPRGLEIAEF